MWKEGLVRPKLERVNVDLIKKNYRPVSNLTFLSEITEKAATLQISDFIQCHFISFHFIRVIQSDVSRS